MANGAKASRHAIRARLRELIAGALPGDRLPSERELSQRWGAARMTVRHATDALIAEGLVARRHGSGSYVLPRPVVHFLGLTSFTQDMRARGLVPGARVLAFTQEPADGPTAADLGIPLDTPVVRFTRLRTGSSEPMAVETVQIPAAQVPGLQAADLGGSLYELLATRYRVAPGSASVTIEPVVPDEATRRLLAIPDVQACLRLRMTDADARGRILMTADCIYRGDRYQLRAEVTGPTFSGGAMGVASTSVSGDGSVAGPGPAALSRVATRGRRDGTAPRAPDHAVTRSAERDRGRVPGRADAATPEAGSHPSDRARRSG